MCHCGPSAACRKMATTNSRYPGSARVTLCIIRVVHHRDIEQIGQHCAARRSAVQVANRRLAAVTAAAAGQSHYRMIEAVSTRACSRCASRDVPSGAAMRN